jgi:hypothetical protein
MLMLTRVARTCFVYCFDSFTCACLLVEVFSRSSRGTAGRRSTRRVEPPVARRHGGCRAGATYFQTSSQLPPKIIVCVVRVWGREDSGCTREATSAACQPRSLRHASPSGVQCMQHRTGAQIWVFRLSTFTLESSFLLSHCMTCRVVSARSRAVWLQLSIRPHIKFRPARLPPKKSLLSLAPRVMTP